MAFWGFVMVDTGLRPQGEVPLCEVLPTAEPLEAGLQPSAVWLHLHMVQHTDPVLCVCVCVLKLGRKLPVNHLICYLIHV